MTFGQITALEAEDSIIYLADKFSGRISTLDFEGNILSAIGRKGAGPGEFIAPVALVIASDTAYVYDQGTIRITKYLIRDGTLAYKGDFRLAFPIEDFCFLDDAFYALGFHAGAIVHRLSREGDLLASFGEPFFQGGPAANERSTQGLIACDSSEKAVIIGAALAPVVRKYSHTGELVWESKPPDFEPTRITLSRGAVTYTAPEGQRLSTLMVVLQVLSTGVVIVQYGEPGPGAASSEDISQVRTAILNASNGRLRWYSKGGYPRVDIYTAGFALARPTLPYPRVTLHQWEWADETID